MTLNSEIKRKLKTKNDIHLARKIWHFLGVAVITVIYNNISRYTALSLTLTLAITFLIFDVIRLNVPEFNRFFVKFGSLLLREREKYTYTGTTALFFGVFFIIYLFPTRIVQLSLICLAIADPVASYFGIKYGKDKIFGNKSLQGTLAAFVSCTVIAVVFYSIENLMTFRILIASLLTGLSGAISEAVVIGKLDDNFSFPILNSFFLYFIFILFGAL